jgi:hypothetical protein
MLSRRQFLSLVASGVAAETLFPDCEPAVWAEFAAGPAPGTQEPEVHLQKRYTPQHKSYGSGYFGVWITDDNGLPCYQYTCVQTGDPTAVTPVETAWRAATDHTHQVGNDRILAAASNYGYLQVRQDEGGPKFLNDYQPEAGLYGAGIGYLTDGEEILGTYYPGNGTSFDRFFGVGYLRKQTAGKNYSVDQTIYAPFGDDPVLISEVVIASQSPKPANLYWVEYWGCQPYEFSSRAFEAGRAANGQLDPENVVALRRESALRYEHRFETMPGGMGIVESKHLRAQPAAKAGAAAPSEPVNGSAAKLPLDAQPASPGTEKSPAAQPPGVSATDEIAPPSTFLASLDDGRVSFLTNAAAFFGDENRLSHTGPAGPDSVPIPTGLLRPSFLEKLVPVNVGDSNPLRDDLSATGPQSALILVKPFTLDPGRSQSFRFLYGYLPEGFSAASLVAQYREKAPGLFAQSSAQWKEEGIRFSIAEEPWVERESGWHNYYLRSGFTYDDFFREHIVSQGQTYQYCNGFQGAVRDPLQHALPLIFGDAKLAKEVLRYTLKSQSAEGVLPFAITGHGSLLPFPWQASDLALWLLWLASEYVLATRDTGFLDERLPGFPLTAGGPTLAVREKIARSYRHLVETIGTGKHGLLRGLNDDWNDNIFRQGVAPRLSEEVQRESESVMNAAIAAYVLDRYAAMLRYSGDTTGGNEAAERAGRQRDAVRAQWAGQWFKRLWLGPAGGWVGGPERMWLDGQPWAILGGCATPEQRKTLIQGIDELLRKPSKIGAKQVSAKVDWPGFMPGEAENGGVWAALDGPLIWALAESDPAMAWDEWRKNSRAHHADSYPGVWYGIWSGPDVYCSSDSQHAGQTAYDWGLVDPDAHRLPSVLRGLSNTAWPVMNMHRHAWPLFSAAKLLGIEFTEAGVDLAPTLPRPEYSFRSKLLGLEKTAQGYEGWYEPQKGGSWTLRVKLPSGEGPFKTLVVNEAGRPTPAAVDGTIHFEGSSAPGRPLRWALRKS